MVPTIDRVITGWVRARVGLVELGARLFFAVPMIASGLRHFARVEEFREDVPLPLGTFWVLSSGVLLVVAGGGVLLGRRLVLAAFTLAGYLLAVALIMHVPDVLTGDDDAVPQMRSAFALAAGAVFVALWTIERARRVRVTMSSGSGAGQRPSDE